MELARFLDKVVDQLFFTVITVSDELNAFKVFETLNARGVRLSATDLLKNYLFSVINADKAHGSELKSLEEQWERIVELLGNESFPDFLRTFWNSRNKLVRTSDLFKTIRKRIVDRRAAFELLRDLDRSAATYAALRDASDPMWSSEERRCLEQLAMYNVRQPLPMLLICHDRFFENDRASFTRLLRALTVISFRYNVICSLQTPEQERVYNDVAVSVFTAGASGYWEIIRALQPLYPEDEAFRGAFSVKELRTTSSRNKKVVRYILFEIEHHLSRQTLDSESALYTVVHILPENPSEEWSYIEEAKQEQLASRLGNMTLLEAKLNRELGNATYQLKRDIYEKSSLRVARDVSKHYDTRSEERVNARQKQLAKIACELWRIDFRE